MTSDPIYELEQALSDYFGRRHCVVVGSGTTALYCIFEVLNASGGGAASDRPSSGDNADYFERPKVLFPVITCETAVNASIFAGMRPEFADVSLGDFTITPETAATAVGHSDISIAVPTHIFGHLTDVAEIESRLPSSVAMVEDAAQAYGGALDDCRAGSMGWASIISFGVGKIIDCGSGGAVLTDDGSLAEGCRRVAAGLSNGEDHAAVVRANVMAEMMAAKRAYRQSGDREKYVSEQARVLRHNRAGYLAPCTPETAARVLRQLPRLEVKVADRLRLTERLDEVLSSEESVALPSRRGRPALWRYTFRVIDGRRDEVADALRESGVEASKLFALCTDKFSSTGLSPGRSAELSETLINLHLPSEPKQQDHLLHCLEEVFR
jgi:dTDP-4-amino-4,6-dideoxygalactose transaminase